MVNAEARECEFDNGDDPEQAVKGPAVWDVRSRAEGHYGWCNAFGFGFGMLETRVASCGRLYAVADRPEWLVDA